MMRISIIGAGNMGGAVALGIASQMPGVVVTVSNPHDDKLNKLKEKNSLIETTTSNVAAVTGADVVILAVKPWILPGVVEEISPVMEQYRPIVVSMAGGIGLADLDKMVPESSRSGLFYVIPNTAALVGESMTFMSSQNGTKQQIDVVAGLFKACGKVAVVEERMMNSGMVTASCGIAFAMRFMRAMEQGAVELGLRPGEARAAVLQTMKGAAELLQVTGDHPEAAIDAVTTAGGLTIRGLNVMEQDGMPGAVINGMRAAMPRK